MSLKRIVIAVLLAAAVTAVAASAQESGDLLFQKTLAGPQEVIQRTALLALPAPPAGPALQQAFVNAAIDWLVRHGYLTTGQAQSFGAQVTISGSCITITYHVPGGPDIVIVLPNGPFLPADYPYPNRLMTVVVVRAVQDISNGF
jgi:hypothetical protein